MNLRLWAIAPLLGLSVVVTAEEFGPSIYSGMNARFDPAAEARYRQPEAELRLLLAYQQAPPTISACWAIAGPKSWSSSRCTGARDR